MCDAYMGDATNLNNPTNSGGGMFVQTVVVGRVIFLSRERVQCQGQLIRDVAVYAVAASLVFFVCLQGRVFFSGVLLMFATYFVYVATVVAFEIRRHYTSTKSVAENSESETLSAASSFEERYLETSTASCANSSGEKESRKRDPPGTKYSARVLRLMTKQQNRKRQRIVEKRKGLVVERCDLPSDVGSKQSSIWTHFHTTIYKDILRNSDLPAFERFCLVLEVPFIVLRQLVTPITSVAEYNRSVLATSVAFSPLWLCFYASMKYEHDSYAYCLEKTLACVPFVVWPFCLSIFLGAAIVMKFPLKADELELKYSIPIALYGFGVATSFIDVIR